MGRTILNINQLPTSVQTLVTNTSGVNTGDQTLSGLGGLPLTGGTLTGSLTNNNTNNLFFRSHQEFVLEQLSKIVTNPVNIKRVIFFDENGATTTLKDRAGLGDATLSANASTLSPTVVETCRTLNYSPCYF